MPTSRADVIQQESTYIACTCDNMEVGKPCFRVDGRAPATRAGLSHRASLVRGPGAHCWCVRRIQQLPISFQPGL